jgi:hypothetical protein
MNAPRRLALVLALFFAACGGDDTPPPGMDAGADVDLGMVEIDADVPDPDAGCVAGTIGCACDAGMCATGVCAMGICTTCPVASEGCACRSNGTCDSGLRCDASGTTCEACPPGELDCACDASGACSTGLICAGGTCTLETCAAGSVGCLCRMDAPRCDGDSYCDGTTCRTCAPDVAGCPCASDGACGPGLACEVSTCRVALTCEELVVRGTCSEGQVCEVFPSGDPRCTPGACTAGYRWSTATGRCVACTSTDCTAEPTCTLGVPGSIADTCAREMRDCVTDVDGLGACGDCSAGLAEVAGRCVFLNACGSGTCAATEYCDRTDAANPACLPRPCANPTEVRTATGCVPCGRVCASPGQTGTCWAFADRDGRGVCETVPGYYAENSGSRGAVDCDADRDGWVRAEVGEILDGTPGFPADPALVANARCEIRKAGTVALIDEYGNASRVVSCAEGLLQDPEPSTACTPFPLRLFETRVNDAGEGTTGAVPPAYTTGVAPMLAGRAFRPAELNGLTKGCVDLADFDGDGNEDVGQSQPTPLDTSTMSERARLRSFAHFVELYRTAWTDPAPGETLGVLTIAERSRCDGSFPLSYGSDTLYTGSTREPRAYWRSCERDRDPDFNADVVGTPGFDFARYACSDRSGRCGVNPGAGASVVDGPTGSAWSTPSARPPQPAPASASAGSLPPITIGTSPTGARTLASGTLLRGHGLCELGGARPADGRFRGMNHHSQFQCVQVVPDAVTPTRSWQHRRSEFGGPSATNATTTPASTLTFNACRVKSCDGAVGCVDSTAPASRDASDPVVECDVALLPTGAPALPAEGATGWAAVRYQSYAETNGTRSIVGDATYNGGCVNEVAEWPNLCPRALFGACDAGGSDAFGRFCCDGCSSTVGCPRDHAAGTCRNGVCDTAACDPGWGNCDDPVGAADTTGCENSLNTVDNCNTCGTGCVQLNANMICTETNPADPDSEVCRRDPAMTLGSGTGCKAGWGDCNGMPDDGCENPLESAAVAGRINHCGACGATCFRDNATVTCGGDGAGGGVVGTCALSTCNATYFNIDADPSDGCEFFDNNTNGVCTGVDTMPPAGAPANHYSATLATAGTMWTSQIGTGAAAVDRRTPGVWVTPPTPRPTLAENWYKFYFPKGARGSTRGAGVGSPRVYLSSGAGQYVLDVWAFTMGGGRASDACTSTAIAPDAYTSVTRACTKPSSSATGTGAIGGGSGLNGGTTGMQGWQFTDDVSDTANGFTTTDNGWPEYVYVRVRRRVPGSLDTTPTYRLTVTR